MSRPISDAQIYGLLWAATNAGFSELHEPPSMVRAPDGRHVRLLRTAFDRAGLVGLRRRGLLSERDHGLWKITDAGLAELRSTRIVARISAMADATAVDDRRTAEEDE